MPHRTGAGYVAVLEHLLLAFRLPVARHRAHRRTVVSTGLSSSVPLSLERSDKPGRWTVGPKTEEPLVTQHLRVFGRLLGKDFQTVLAACTRRF